MRRARVGAVRGQGVAAVDAIVRGAVVVASRNDLIRLQAGTGRDRDLLDIGDLIGLDE